MPDLLFSPLRIGAKLTRNRILMPAVVTNFAIEHRLSPRLIAHLRARAEGGAGMIVMETSATHPTTLTTQGLLNPHMDTPDALARAADAVESADCRLLAQIFHLGGHHVTTPGALSLSPAGHPDPASWVVPHKLSRDEINIVIDGFVSTAALFAKAGFSGVELHGAQGFLLLQFLSPRNDREDGYGGDLEGRTRLVREIAEGVRQTCGGDFLIALKMPSDEGLGPAHMNPREAAAIVARLGRTKAFDLFSFGHGGPGRTFDEHVPDLTFPHAPFVSDLPALRAAAGGIPIVGLGRIANAREAEDALAAGACDMVGLARPLLADPRWPEKSRQGRAAEIKRCLYCNACWGQISRAKELACVVNPDLGADEAAPIVSAPNPRRVLVVGAGPAGLQAANEAAARGHEVEVWERAGEPGGWAAWQARLPGRAEIGLLVSSQTARAAHLGVRVIHNRAADAEAIAQAGFDDVILATGSFPPPSPLQGDRPVLDVAQALDAPGGTHFVLYDQIQTEAIYAAIEALASRFQRITILSPRASIATECNLIALTGVMRRMGALGVRFHGFCAPPQWREGVVRWTDSYSGEEKSIADVDAFAHAAPRRAADSLFHDLHARGVRALLIGDALSPRTLLTATHEGHAAGRRVGEPSETPIWHS